MHHRTRSTLLGLGFDSDLVDKIGRLDHTVEILRAFGEQRLLDFYTAPETALIRAKLDRTPIPPEVVERILERSGGCCCVCRDGLSSRPYQLHHCRPYAQTQDNSENNLILVCPTHHAVFHEAPVAEVDQLQYRDSWYALRALAADFTAKGVAFPYGAFEPIDFSAPPDFGDLVELSALTPATAMACLPREFAATGLSLLRSHRSLMVIGASGAGKSTYALGLAGRLNGDSGVRIYRYLRRQKDSDSLGELTAALSCIAKPTLFIVDDLNSWAALPAIEKLAELAAASPQALLLATISSEDAGSAERLGLASRSHQFLVWESLRDTLTANLIANEYLATERLMQMRNAGNTRLAFGHDHTFWKDNVEEAAQAAQSAYDLVFRIRGSREGAREAARAFLDREGSHLALLAAAIEQIAGFERPVFPRDVATLLQTLPAAPGLPPSNADWVERVYQRGVRQRHLTAARGAYTTVHRRWAADFIDECLTLPAARAAASQLLTSEFMIGFQSPARLMRLWSWLQGKPACEPFCVEWMQRLGRSELARLGACMMADGSLGIFSYFVHESFFFSRADSWKPILHDILVDNEVRLTALVPATGPAEWRTLRDLFNVTELVAPGLLKRILAGWPAERMARLVGATSASQYTNVYWAFGSISKADPEWAAQVGKELQWPEIKRSLETAPLGVVSDLGDLLQVLAIMRFTFMRSMSRDYLKAVGRTLENVSLDDLHVSFGDTWFDILVALFCEEADLEFARIDHARWARELTQGLSRRWEVLSFVHHLFLMAGSRQLQKVFSQIDRTQLAEMISRHAPTYRQELRWVLLISASFDELTRAEWSEFCRPQVETILAARTKEASSLLTDFSRLDPTAARGLATRHGVSFKIPKELSSHPYILRKQRAECKKKDALGTDYDTELLRWEEPTKEDSAATASA